MELRALNMLAVIATETGIELTPEPNLPQPTVWVQPGELLPVMAALRNHPDLYFDLLESITGVDLQPREEAMAVVYHLRSILYGHLLVVKVRTNRPPTQNELADPIPSVCHLWRTAEWHERETFDLLGIPFTNHPDLRRMFLPADWQGFPLRKDYTEAEAYHGIKIN